MGDKRLFIFAALTPEQSEHLYKWLCKNDWFLLVYIGLVLLGVLLSIKNWYSSRNINTDEIREELKEFELNPIINPKVENRKTINPITSLILGIIIAIGLPFVFLVIIFFLVSILQ